MVFQIKQGKPKSGSRETDRNNKGEGATGQFVQEDVIQGYDVRRGEACLSLVRQLLLYLKGDKEEVRLFRIPSIS